jgi:hypothetical protein
MKKQEIKNLGTIMLMTSILLLPKEQLELPVDMNLV